MKKMILGVVIGMLLGSAVPAFAAVGNQIAAKIVKYNLLIDGKAVPTEVSQISYQDTTYVPLRAFANTFGWDVTFKGDSNTIEFTRGSGAVPYADEIKAKNDLLQEKVDIEFKISLKQQRVKQYQDEISELQTNKLDGYKPFYESHKKATDPPFEDSEYYEGITGKIADKQAQIDGLQAEIADLEQQKATLEAQLSK